MPDFLSVYITVPAREAAGTIARALVEERLAACVNILPAMHSVYRWQGKVEEADEWALIAKTRAALFAALEKRVKELHPHACPCIAGWPIVAGHRPYLDWIETETR
ncbi:MAG TPA: divalent-cation tolerance protein CutA [Alphaproteobacteria bacterium]|jgi:periplasmic divalent cation tolerance protein|nr:divalent-cation tolerance protein CutA [Alphaproteobacteria bacterium]